MNSSSQNHQNPTPYSGQINPPATAPAVPSPNTTSVPSGFPVNPGIPKTPDSLSPSPLGSIEGKPAQQTSSASPIPYSSTTNIPNNLTQSPSPYANQTIAQDLTESNVIGKAVTVTDNNLSVRDKIPLMKISLLLIFIITGFSGSFLYFRFTSASPVKNTAISLPTVTISSQKPAVIATPVENSVNPFATTSASFVNPFAPTSTPSYQNPFAETTANATVDNQTYQNPFENLK